MGILLGRWTEDKLDLIMREFSKIKEPGLRIEFISRQFLNIDYKESTLIGDVNTPEVFVINLEGVDCFTFIDYIEAMRLSGSFSEFKENLKKVRYRGKVTYESRKHFFTDWLKFNTEFVMDVTEEIGGQKTKSVIKILNIREDGTYLLQGIRPVQREIKYIPSGAIDNSIINKLRTGDYAGIYSEKPGLDVSHVGIIIKDINAILRHASLNHRKVVDQDFRDYISNKLGLIVLRPKD